MLASSWLDPVLGIDIHWEMVPTPPPVPMPIPNPFTGIVFDPMGLAVGLAISNAIGAVKGASFKGPVIYWGAFPATNTGTEAKHVPGHILIPPGTAWAPVPRTPQPTIHPGETPKPPSPVKPYDDASVVFGSKTVSVMGSNAVRIGDIALSCSEPVRLPSSFVIAIPKGAPILIGGPMSLDLLSAVMASLKTRFMSDSLHALISRMKPSRFRNLLHWGACRLTGHPVDVATGKLVTSQVDASLPGPGPLSLKIERHYSSAFASRAGVLGNGWSSSLDQAVWEERGQVVYLAADGREIVFDAFDLPGHRMAVGDELFHPIDRILLRKEAEGAFTIRTLDGIRYDFAPVSPGGAARIRRVSTPCQQHSVTYHYDAAGQLELVRDGAGRAITIEHDARGRMSALKLPLADGHGQYVHRRYEYDASGDLMRVVDSQGHAFSYEYVTHLMVRETDRTGLSFFFQYDGYGEDAWCTRTWGDGGIHDHAITYDKKNHVTYVRDSLGKTSQFHMNVAGLVTKVVDPLGNTTEYAYDPRTLARTEEIDPVGRRMRFTYDARGNLLSSEDPAGAITRYEYDPSSGLRIGAIEPSGARYAWSRDSAGRIVERTLPSGERFRYEWRDGLIASIVDPGGDVTTLEYDAQKQLARVRQPGGGERRLWRDNLGRVVKEALPGSAAATRLRYDSEGRPTQIESRLGVHRRMRWDPEGNLLEVEDPTGFVALEYAGFHRNVARRTGVGDASSEIRWDFDTEGRLIAIHDELGQVHRFVHDAAGRVVEEIDFGGRKRRYTRDAADRVIAIERASSATARLTYDRAGRLARLDNDDGTFVAYRYGADGRLLGAESEGGAVELERDGVGRVVREVQGAHEVRSRYAPGGGRLAMETSLGARAAMVHDEIGAVVSLSFGQLAPGSGDSLPRAPGARADEVSVAFERDEVGRELARLLPGGVRVDWTRDEAGRPTRRRTRLSDRELDALPYVWRGDDRLVQVGERTFERDARGRVVRERVGSTSTPEGSYAIDRAMDAVDNVYRRADRERRRYGPGGLLEEAEGTRYEYDADGQRVARIELDGSTWRYAWDGHGRLVEVERPDALRVRMRYDAFARRTEQRLVRIDERGEEHVEERVQYVWDGNALVHELTSEGDAEGALTTWIWEPGGKAPIAKGSGGRWWTMARDHLGTPTEMYDEAGALAWKMQLDVWGVPALEVGTPADCPWRYPGQYADRTTGLFYNRHRHYDPSSGTYVSPDPAGLGGGLRPYAYPADPVLYADPSGLAAAGGCTSTEDRENPWNEFQRAHKGQFDSPSSAAAAYADLKTNQSPWPIGHTPTPETLPPGTRFEMALGPGQPPTSPGGFGTMDSIVDDAYARNQLAIKEAWKPDIGRVVTYEVTQPLPVLSGPVGPQIDGGNYLPGGGSQVQMQVPPAERMNYLKVVDERPI